MYTITYYLEKNSYYRVHEIIMKTIVTKKFYKNN